MNFINVSLAEKESILLAVADGIELPIPPEKKTYLQDFVKSEVILICTPIFLPVASSIGVDPYQFGMLLMMNLGLGLCTPPVGSVLFVGCAVGGVRLEDAVKTIWPFYLAILIALLFVTFFPAISMTLPNLLG
jgi:TRAP-type C4-dicarboxylate transport system permease large subunit